MTATYILTCSRDTRNFTGTLAEAIETAIAMEWELEPSFGVAIVDAKAATVAEIRDGVPCRIRG
jgi:hypothetical protein